MSLRPTERAELRRSVFKASVDADGGRLRRVGFTVEIRKTSRAIALHKRRRAAAGTVPHPPPALEKLGILPQVVQGLYSVDSSVQLEAIVEFSKLLSIENPLMDEVIRSGVVPCFVQLLEREDCPELQFEAAWVLTNIASGTQENAKVVVDHGAVPIFVKLLSSPSKDVREQAVWALGNVAGNAAICRDLVFANVALFPLVQLFNEHIELSMLRKATWALSSFCRDWSLPNFEHVKPALLVLWQLIQSQDEEVLCDACWALSYLSDGSDGKIQAVIDGGACPRLVQLLTHSSPSVLIPALRVIGNIARGDDVQIQCIIDHQALPCLLNLLTTNEIKGIKDEVCWTISNITAGNKEQIQSVINGNIIGPLVHLMQTAEFDVKEDAAWAITNATSGGTHDQIKYIVSQGCIKAFCDLLSYADTSILMVSLVGLDSILRVGQAEKCLGACDVNMYTQMVDDAEGLDKIENLQTHDNNTISEMAAHLLDSYWLRQDNAIPFGVDGPQTGFHYGNEQVSVPPGYFDFG